MNGSAPNGAVPVSIWVKVEMRGPQIQCSGNAPIPTLCNLLKEGMVNLGREMEKKERATLVTPVTGPLPPMRRL